MAGQREFLQCLRNVIIAARWTPWTAGANELAANTDFHGLKKMGSLGAKGTGACFEVSLFGNSGAPESINEDSAEIAEHPAIQKNGSEHPHLP